MQLEENAVVLRGRDQGTGFTGGANRSGGAAKGIPRNLLTVAVELGKCVVVPITTPASSVAVGAATDTGAARTTDKDKIESDAKKLNREVIARNTVEGLAALLWFKGV